MNCEWFSVSVLIRPLEEDFTRDKRSSEKECLRLTIDSVLSLCVGRGSFFSLEKVGVGGAEWEKWRMSGTWLSLLFFLLFFIILP